MVERLETSLIQKEDTKTGVCRVCLDCETEETGKALSLFEKHYEILISEKINYIANIDIREGDGLPDKICSKCLLALENACNFKEKCENSDAILQSTLQFNQPLYEHVIEVPVTEEVPNESEYDYLGESVLSPAALQSDDEVKPKLEESQSNTFKSRAIDLKLECHDCGEFFKSKCKIRVHWKQVHQPKYLTCPRCKKTFKSFKAYHSHLKRDTKSCRIASKLRVEGEGKSRMYYCQECNYNSKSLQCMKVHEVVHSGERPYACNICSKGFSRNSSLIDHKETVHYMPTSVGRMCYFCGKLFESPRSFYRHLRVHKKTLSSCKVCLKTFKTQAYLQVHMKRHSGVKSYTCEFCAKAFFTASELCSHKSYSHGKKKVYACQSCEFKTIHCGVMCKHRKLHTPDNIACEVCGKFLENDLQLTLHKQRHFKKDHQCVYCEKWFFSRKSLLEHVRRIHNVFAFDSGQSSVDKKKITTAKTHAKSNVKAGKLTHKL